MVEVKGLSVLVNAAGLVPDIGSTFGRGERAVLNQMLHSARIARGSGGCGFKHYATAFVLQKQT